MKTSFINLRKRYRIPSPPRLETGFSMLEAVVVVGVLLALAVGGFFAFGPIVENAKIAKVRSAASEVHTGVLVASMDGNADTTPEDVISDWNANVDKIKVALVDSQGGNGDFCVSAQNVESPHITHQTGSCVPGSGSGTPGGSNPDTDGDGIPDSTDPDIDGDGTPNASDTTPNGENVANPGSDTVVDPGSGSPEPEAGGGIVAASAWSTQRAITNQYPDPGFKTGVNGWTPHGVLNYPNDANIATISYGTGAPGDAGGLQFSATGTASTYRTTVYFPMDNKELTHLSFLISSANGKWDPNASWHAGFVHTDINGNHVSSDGGQAVSVGEAGVFSRYSYESSMGESDTIANSYLFIQATHIPAGQTVTLNVDRMYVAGGDECFYCNPFPAPTVPNYEPNFDGSYPANAHMTYRWLGAENASKSVATVRKRIAAPTTAEKGDIIEVKGEGYSANSTVTPVIYTGSSPSSSSFRGTPVQTDSSGNFATTVSLETISPFNYKVSVAEDDAWRASVDMTVTGPPISEADAPGPWTKREGTTQEMSVASVIKKGTTITIMGRGYLPGTRLNVYDSVQNYNWVQTVVDDNGYYSVQVPVSTNNGTSGSVEVWNSSLGSFFVPVTYE